MTTDNLYPTFVIQPFNAPFGARLYPKTNNPESKEFVHANRVGHGRNSL